MSWSLIWRFMYDLVTVLMADRVFLEKMKINNKLVLRLKSILDITVTFFCWLLFEEQSLTF